MCDISDGFKLCTCSEVLQAPDWVYLRLEDPGIGRLGSVAMPVAFDERVRLEREVPGLLDLPQTWDFDVQPAEGDRLVFYCLGPTPLPFEFHGGRWRRGHASFGDFKSVRHGWLERPTDAVPEDVRALVEQVERSPDDEATRQVAADALESQGAEVLAQWLRLEQLERQSPQTDGAFRDVAVRLSRHVRARLMGSGPIQNCPRSGCPGDWRDLTPGAEAVVRNCPSCHLAVTLLDHHIRPSYLPGAFVHTPSSRRMRPALPPVPRAPRSRPWWAFWRT